MKQHGISSLSLISGAAIGAGLMYLGDPNRGSRLRAFARDKVVRGTRLAAEFADKGIRDLRNRARGTMAEAWSAIRRREVSDEILIDRVRAKIGRAISHPSAIDLSASRGRVTLSGPVLEREVDEFIDSVYSVRGVREVENRLEARESGENIPGLQGSERQNPPRSELFQGNWAPGDF